MHFSIFLKINIFCSFNVLSIQIYTCNHIFKHSCVYILFIIVKNKFINYVYIEQKMLILINSFYAVLNWSEDFNNFSYHKYIINMLFCL